MSSGDERDDPRTALVLAGGGARGAYEAGALSVLLPLLAERGERPTMLIGTSVGALTAAFLATAADDSPVDALAAGLARWREADKGNVLGSVLLQAPLAAARYVGSMLSVPGARLAGLLDPVPLAKNLDDWIRWPAIRANVESGALDLLAVVTTAVRSGRTTVFVDSRTPFDPPRSTVVDYVATEIDSQHVRASAAIPILFPPVRVDSPARAAGWYIDGGIRFNTPIKPALDLGADKLIVVGTGTAAQRADPGPDDLDEPPALADAAVNVLHGALVDPLVEDLRNLGNINVHYVSENGCEPDSGPGRLRRAEGKDPYRLVPYVFTGPPHRGAIGELASAIFEKRYGGARAFRSLDFGLLNAVLEDGSAQHGELLSYLFFDAEFIDELIHMGREDCERWLRSVERDGGDIWRVGPPEAVLTTA